MTNMDQIIEKVKWMPNGLIHFMEKWIRKLPSVKKEINKQTESMASDLESMVKPYSGEFQSHAKLPESGIDRSVILDELKNISASNLLALGNRSECRGLFCDCRAYTSFKK